MIILYIIILKNSRCATASGIGCRVQTTARSLPTIQHTFTKNEIPTNKYNNIYDVYTYYYILRPGAV